MQVRYSYVRRLCSVLGSPSAKRGTTKTQSSSSSLAKLFVDDDSTLSSLKLKRPSDSGDSSNGVFKHISSIFYADKSAKKPDSEEIDGEKKFENMSNLSWLSSVFQSNVLLQWKEQSRKKKQKCVFDFTQESRFQKLVEVCARILGPEATIELFGKVGREPDVKGYNTLVEMCIDKARGTDDKDIAIQELGKVFNLFKSMREQGLELQEQTYRPLLLYLIDMCMVEEFQFFCVVIEDENPSSVARLGYYEMLLWLKDNNEEKIQGICDNIAENKGEDTSDIQENYLLALCESERMEEILKLLEIIDIKNLSSAESVAKVFQALGRLLLEPVAEKFLLDFKTSDHEADNITDFIASYAVSIPDLSVKDVIKKFKDLHQRLEVSPSSSSYEKLILHSCALLKVHVALDIVDEMCEAGLTLSTKVLHSILQICDDTSEYNLVHRIFSTIHRYNLESNDETFRSMIDLFLKMKDIEGAYKMLDDLGKLNLKPSPGMYNAILEECFREKNISDGVRVLEHMQCADVKPDSQTFSYLISNSETEEDIVKYYEELKQSGIVATKQIFMALVNAYAACGQLEKAKKVILDPLIPPKSLNQIKGFLVSVLASHGKLSEALVIYEEIKQSGHKLEAKEVTSLIEHTHSEGELDRLLLLLKELDDTDYWNDACCRIILYCIWNKHLSSAVELCNLLKDKFQSDEQVMEFLFDKVFSLIEESEESSHLHTCSELLSEIKDKLGLLPSHKRHDSLLCACANATDLHDSE
ncbi:pentatricopeptide repeat-containing protein At4g04790, mitochondrial-like [Glycine soja]|uniref:pentatricopeptide repeat-containing protein At4g04790, mitochondrial-like n=1 Tax=Glycine soja TaxID=3848 RepID=UPI00054A6F51|nr:pentatricopeptide repeat-containing protein At4g04790, mitochondrial-like [Glycine soja]KHN27972.1 Pentatricopeptide repeat-containing protein, mitochondrial [Glycine soja]